MKTNNNKHKNAELTASAWKYGIRKLDTNKNHLEPVKHFGILWLPPK